jgi:hypothetical protein
MEHSISRNVESLPRFAQRALQRKVMPTILYRSLSENVESVMLHQKINRVCAMVPIILSLTAFVWILGNVSGGLQSGGDEGTGFYIFWLLILMQMPFVLGYVATADWTRWRSVTGQIVLQGIALILAFAPVAFFKL